MDFKQAGIGEEELKLALDRTRMDLEKPNLENASKAPSLPSFQMMSVQRKTAGESDWHHLPVG
jgi:hypothetical protein